MDKLPPMSLYLHIPWCVKKCAYCDFNAYSLKGELPHKEYVDHLLIDLERDLLLTSGRPVDTLFIGGGTPNLMSDSAIGLLLDGIRQRMPLSPNTEITMEANPGVDSDRFPAYQKSGINRISIGIQSFDTDKLFLLNRIHDAVEARRVAKLLSSLDLKSFNIDLMYGLPEQSLEGALNDLSAAIELEPSHLSWYHLTIEENTLFTSKKLALPDDHILWDIYQQGNKMLTEAGYCHYEISSYALPGFPCRHNINYWRFGDYLGIGCGAHGKLTQPDGTIFRTVKTRHPNSYMQGNYLSQCYPVDSDDLPLEYFMNRFRLFEAVPRVEFTELTNISENTVRHALDKALSEKYILETHSHWHVTEQGTRFLNALLELFI